MQSPIDVIMSYGIPTDSHTGAVQYVMGEDGDSHRPGLGMLTQEQYERNISEIIGLTSIPKYHNLKTARLYFGYTVQETIRAFSGDTVPAMEDVWRDVCNLTQFLIQNQPWCIRDYAVDNSGTQKLDAAGNVKQKKGAKKELVKKIWNENKHKDMTRKEWIALFCAEAGLTPAGASTYYANAQKGKL